MASRCETRAVSSCRFPLCHWRDISPGGGECGCARTSPFGERAQLLRRRGPVGRRGNPREDIDVVSSRRRTRPGCSCRFPLCHWRDISPGGGESACSRTSPFRERCPAGRRGNPRDHIDVVAARRGAGRVRAALATFPSVTGVTSPPAGENAGVRERLSRPIQVLRELRAPWLPPPQIMLRPNMKPKSYQLPLLWTS